MSENEWDSQAVSMALIGSTGFCPHCNRQVSPVQKQSSAVHRLTIRSHSFLPCLPPAEQHTHKHTHVCTHGDRLELKLQASPRRSRHHWMSVHAEIQIVNQSDSTPRPLPSPQNLIRRHPTSLKFPVCLVAPLKKLSSALYWFC